MSKFYFGGLLSVLIFLNGCGENNSAGPKDSKFKLAKSVVNVDADPGLQSILHQQQTVFEYQHDSVTLNIAYKNEPEMLQDFGSKKAGVLVIARALTDREREHLKNADTIYTREIEVAYDAVALVANKHFDDSKLDMAMLKGYFDPKNANAQIPKLVFDRHGSSIINYMLSALGDSGVVSPNLYALDSIAQLVEYLQKNDNAIGFVPFNYLSDTNNEKVRQMYKRIKILSLRVKDDSGSLVKVSANQSDIATGLYPFKRTLTTIMRYGYGDTPEWAFVNFLYRERGGKIFLKAGLVPAKRSEREIIVNTDGYKAVNQ